MNCIVLFSIFSDLYGAIGHPMRMARTVVVGRKADLVKKFLYMLSYFIRCSDVHEAPFTQCLSSLLDAQTWQGIPPSRAVSMEDSNASDSTIENMPSPLEFSPTYRDLSRSKRSHFKADTKSNPDSSDSENRYSSRSCSDSESRKSTSTSRNLTSQLTEEQLANKHINESSMLCSSCGSCSSAFHFYARERLNSCVDKSEANKQISSKSTILSDRTCVACSSLLTSRNEMSVNSNNRTTNDPHIETNQACVNLSSASQPKNSSNTCVECNVKSQHSREQRHEIQYAEENRTKCQCGSESTQTDSSHDCIGVSRREKTISESSRTSTVESDPKTECRDSGIENDDSIDTTNLDEGQCRISSAFIIENSQLENIHHVRRSVVDDVKSLTSDLPCELEVGLKSPSSLRSDLGCDKCEANREGLDIDQTQHPESYKQESSTKRYMSMLSQQLAADQQAEEQKAKMKEVQRQFLAGGTNSMFEEYFDGDVETKTIDEVSDHQLVVKHPLVEVRTSASSPSPSVHSRDGASKGGCISSGEEGAPSHFKNNVSRQNSVDPKPHVSRPTALNPARCRYAISFYSST